MSQVIERSEFFIANKALSLENPSYVERPADAKLFNLAMEGHFCYVFGPNQIGKTSLMLRTAARLRQQNVRAATIELSKLDNAGEASQQLLAIIQQIAAQLQLKTDPDSWWAVNASTKPGRRFISFFQDVLLSEIDEPIVIFLDGIDPPFNSDFLADLLMTIRHIYKQRAVDSPLNRLSIVLLGVATLDDLTTDRNKSPFNVGHQIDLRDFTRAEVKVLKQRLCEIEPLVAEEVFAQIYEWTEGHPYLTQKLCLTVAEIWQKHPENTNRRLNVLTLIQRIFFADETDSNYDPHLKQVEQTVLSLPNRRKLLLVYRQVFEGKRVADNQEVADQNRLKMVGLVKSDQGQLEVRNKIYRQAFNLPWLSQYVVSWGPRVAIAIVLLVLLFGSAAGFAAYRQRQIDIANEAQHLIASWNTTTDAEERLILLAELFRLDGQKAQAQTIFYDILSPEERLALFQVDDPNRIGTDIATVVRGVYASPKLTDGDEEGALLEGMFAPLDQLSGNRYTGEVGLRLEMTNWIKGRRLYQEGQFAQAVEAYKVAISLNNDNPNLYFEQGLALAEQGNQEQALENFKTTLNLSQAWKPRMQQVLIGNSALYNALWNDQRRFGDLVALVPTPTSTPTPTETPLPTPTPTDTTTPVPPTATSTAVQPPTTTPLPTSTPVPLVVPTLAGFVPTATPTTGTRRSLGTFTLISPSASSEVTSGPIEFQWEWNGPLPPEYGFEVRVWREGGPVMGAHDAVLDNQNGNVQNIGGNRYRLRTNISQARGVQGANGTYFWTVGLVQISPSYKDLGEQAAPATLRFDAGTPGGSGNDDTGTVDIE